MQDAVDVLDAFIHLQADSCQRHLTALEFAGRALAAQGKSGRSRFG
jgi:hypothetical protein